MAEPWVKVKVGFIRSDKVASLPSDGARWGWVKALAEGKLQRRMGVFASPAHLAELLGHHGRYVKDYVAAGLAHVVPEQDEAWPETCTDRRCDRYYRETTKPGELVIHDFRLEQRDPTNSDRQDSWRNGRGNGVRNAPRNESLTPHSRALSPSLSLSPSSTTREEPYQVGGDTPDLSDDLLGWLQVTHHVTIRPGNGWHIRVMQWFAQGVGFHDAQQALTAAVDAGNRIDRQVVPYAEDILFPRQERERLTPAERKQRERDDYIARTKAEVAAAKAAGA